MHSSTRIGWLIMALGALGACFGAHGDLRVAPRDPATGGVDASIVSPPPVPRDAGPRPPDALPPDADRCTDLPGVVSGIACGSLADREVFLTTAPPRCCDDTSEVRFAIQRSRSGVTITPTWRACGCAPSAFPCESPTRTVRVSLDGVLDPGVVTVNAGDASCVLTPAPPPPFPGPPLPSSCDAIEPSEEILPRALVAGQRLAATLTAPGTGCGCYPTAVTRGTEYTLGLCGCCGSCDCIDPPYTSYLRWSDALPVGDHLVGRRHAVAIRERASCASITPTGARLLLPPEGHRIDGPEPITWLEIQGRETRCCGTPLPAIELTELPDGDYEAAALSCEPDPCDCDTERIHDTVALLPLPYGLAGRIAIRDLGVTLEVPPS